MFQILAEDKLTQARVGLLKTSHGAVETPCFMPVATKGAVKFVTMDSLKEMQAQAIISNAFILSLNPGVEIIEKAGGLHKFVGFDNVMFTDCGGFQLSRKTFNPGHKDDGLIFKDPFHGGKVHLTSEKIMEIQIRLNSDVAMGLDDMPDHKEPKERYLSSIQRTSIWMEQCKKAHDGLKEKYNSKQLLFAISQGGIFPDLREESIKSLLKLNFDGYAIGGLGMGESASERLDIVKLSTSLLPIDKPRYLMGIGSPLDLLESISLGADFFDSAFPTANARHGTLFTSQGVIHLKNSAFKEDLGPIDESCTCFVCQNYSRVYLRFLSKTHDPVNYIYNSYHNLYFVQDLLRKARLAMKKGVFSDFLSDFKRVYSLSKR